MGRAHDVGVQQSGHAHVLDIPRCTRYLCHRIHAQRAAADDRQPRIAWRWGRIGLATQHCGRGLHRCDDLRIACAAAELAVQRLDNLRRRRVRHAVEQRLGGQQHGRRAEAALDRTVGDERRLEGVQRVRRAEALDGQHLAACDLTHGRQARAHGQTIEQDGACAALALVVAALLRAGEAQRTAQHVEQGRGRVDCDADGAEVDGERNVL